ncbi:hypothetical protein BJX63DRAFT_417694 [Aspergillus granulosus]|uniref:Gfo/Idh/MocA-like oxidoreductase N-terminal domain-containing protein n=1 Tax=Aspergillus granulosus TaxID=176169 RepID=A0ABR4I2B2_9EURO
MTLDTAPSPLRVGILAAGSHPIQTIYLPALHALPKLYTITAVYFAAQLQEPAGPVPANGTATASTTQNPDALLADPTLNLILNFMPNEYHELYTIAALQAGKHVMVETPVSLSIPSARRIIEAEKDAPNGARVFVASARRYAPCFEDVFKKEVRSLERIHYARCRMIAGPHVAHTATSLRVGAGSHEGESQGPPSIKEVEKDRIRRLRGLLEEVFGRDEQPNQERIALSRFLASLGCHDLGLMRDTLGYPDAISNISVNEPFYSALFHYNGAVVDGSHPHPFTLMYEAGTDCVPRCDAQLAVYGHTKTVTIHYDLPYARGQPIRVVVETADERGGLMQTETVSTWEEAYQGELKALYAYLVDKKAAKTTARDSLEDIKLFQTIFEQYDRQCGTIRTPLG